MTQPTFDWSSRKSIKALMMLDRVLWILEDGEWHRGKSLCDQLRTTDRMLRQSAELSKGRILSGQLGYKATRCATNDEIDHAEAWLISQGRKMIDRAREIRVCRNRSGAAA